MMRQRFFFYFFYLCLSVVGQGYDGLLSGAFLPLQKIGYQPADLMFDSARWNINVLSLNVRLFSDLSFQESGFLEQMQSAGVPDLKHLLATERNRTFVMGQLLLPSVSYKISPLSRLAFTSRFRVNGAYLASNADFLSLFNSEDLRVGTKELSNEYFKGVVNSWVEYNLTYARSLWRNHEMSMNVGVTCKFLHGLSSLYFDMDGVNIVFSGDEMAVFDAQLSYAYDKTFSLIARDERIKFFDNSGFGADLGVNFVFQPEALAEMGVPYLIKGGVSVTDLGEIRYKARELQRLSLRGEDIAIDRFKPTASFTGLIDSLKSAFQFEGIEQGHYSMRLGEKVHWMLDFYIRPNVFLNYSASYEVDGLMQMLGNESVASYRMLVTPRYETDKLSAFLPIGWASTMKWKVGLGWRWRGFFIGSGTLLGDLLGGNGDNGIGQIYWGTTIRIK